MNLPLLFARRYLLAKRKHQAINLITLISIAVIAVVTAAMVVVLSTMNGIGELVDSIYSPFDQDLTITPREGKTMGMDSLDLAAVMQRSRAVSSSWIIEENVLLQSGEQQAVARMKGVQEQYLEMSRMGSYLYSGDASLRNANSGTALLGLGLKSDLGVPLDDGVMTPLRISAPIRGKKLSTFEKGAFERMDVAVSGSFSINIDFDTQYFLLPFELASNVLHYHREASALELDLPDKADLDEGAREVQALLGPAYLVRTRYQKNALMYSTTQSEKWFTFLVLSFIGAIGAFNIIASLTMMMIEKREDMRVLRSMGGTSGLTRSIFLFEGILIVGVGAAIGIGLGLLLCLLQQHFGIIALTGSVVGSYPVKVLPTDLVFVLAAVVLIGGLATWVPL
ncbi:MAG: ABC transporter permease, partial [Flavobacteriales bacterium]|nr:ABC transporter permease [Flavobacteriales bacterium]